MAFPAFLDTNVLYGAVLCDTLLRLAEALGTQAAASHRPEMSYTQLLGRLKRAGIGDFVDEVRHRFGSFD